MSSQLSNTVLEAYQKLAYFELRAEPILHMFLPPLDPNRKRPTRWQKLYRRWKHRWMRLISYRIVSTQNWSPDSDWDWN